MMQKNKLAGLALGLLVTLVFISSYVSLTTYNNQQQTTSIPQTYLGIGIANARLTGYSNPLYFNLICSNKTLQNQTSQIIVENLTQLENNNSVLEVNTPNAKNISVAAENMSVYSVYKFALSKLNQQQQGCITAYSDAVVLLPPTVNMSVGTQHFQVAMPPIDRNLTLFSPLSRGINVTLKVKVSALVTGNLTVYQTPSIVLISSNMMPSNTISPTNTSNSMAQNTIPSNTLSGANTITNSNTIPSNGVT